MEPWRPEQSCGDGWERVCAAATGTARSRTGRGLEEQVLLGDGASELLIRGEPVLGGNMRLIGLKGNLITYRLIGHAVLISYLCACSVCWRRRKVGS